MAKSKENRQIEMENLKKWNQDRMKCLSKQGSKLKKYIETNQSQEPYKPKSSNSFYAIYGNKDNSNTQISPENNVKIRKEDSTCSLLQRYYNDIDFKSQPPNFGAAEKRKQSKCVHQSGGFKCFCSNKFFKKRST